MQNLEHAPGLISRFARHRVAANLLMLIMILGGVWALMRINTQFLPTFSVELVSVTIVWPGASAEDIENSITNPLEREFRNIDNLKRLTSISRTSSATVWLEFQQGTNMSKALEDVRDRVSQVPNLPPDSEEPVVVRIEPYERVARLVVSGPKDIRELRSLVRRFERELLDNGIAKIDILGLPDEEIAIQIPTQKLAELNISLEQVANVIAQRSRDLPAGIIGKAEAGRQLRSLEQRRSIREFEDLVVFSNSRGQSIRLRDIATIERRAQDDEVEASVNGKPAVELRLLRTRNANSLASAKILHEWLIKTRAEIGKSANLFVYDETWQLITERINLLLKNGAGGLLLIVGILFLYLNRRVALWVVAGIPASFMAGIAVLYIYGGTINMVSLFAIIMSLGIIVDDTIVVGEQTLTNIHAGQSALDAVINAAHKMLAPIMASSLTTIFAFLPLLLVTGVIGTILRAIPLVVICVIIASLIECFLVLPGHLHHSFKHHREDQEPKFRQKVNARFNHFKEVRFKRLVTWAMRNRALTVCSALGLFIISIAIVIAGYVNFTFFPSPDGRQISADVRFTAGTPEAKVMAFMQTLNKTLVETDKALAPENTSLVSAAVTFKNFARIDNYRSNLGEEYASMAIELTSPDQRKVTNDEFIRAWQKRISIPPGIETLAIYAPRGGPQGEDIDVLFTSKDPLKLKKASLALQNVLRTIPGVSSIKDDLPFGQEQIVYQLNATGRALGLTIDNVGRQLRSAFNGRVAQIFHEPNEEIEVSVMLPDNERNRLSTLENFPIVVGPNRTVPLGTVVDLRFRRGPDVLLHTDTKLGVHITASVDPKLNNANKILNQLQATILPKLTTQYNLGLSLLGKAEEQQETFRDMKYGLILGLSLIYIVLAWVFSSYGWPLLVMLAIPLGLTGAILGHLIMGMDLTILSLFGLFGLSGIVINDSIILFSEYRLLKSEGMPTNEAIIEACTRRLRAVLLTSLTTIAGLFPLLFETSLQAQFLIPMATSITFGLAYATLLILVVVPTTLSLYEEGVQRLHGEWQPAKKTDKAD